MVGSVSVKSDTSVTPKPRVSSAKYARLPSLETENEWMPDPLCGGAAKPWLPWNRRTGARVAGSAFSSGERS